MAFCTKADKVNSVGILHEADYYKVHNFIANSKFTLVLQDTKKTATHRNNRHQRM